jgi:hypothetical protein
MAAMDAGAKSKYSLTRDFVLKIALVFFSASEIDSYLGPNGRGRNQLLLELGNRLNNLGGDFYSFGETLFSETWQKKQIFWENTIDKLESFFMYIEALTPKQFKAGLAAIEGYRKNMGYFDRSTVASRFEWDLARGLQNILSSQLGRWVSQREMGIMFKGRNSFGEALEDDFFTRRVKGKKQQLRQDLLGELMIWIENPITWSHGGDEYSMQLTGSTLEQAKIILNIYNEQVYDSKNVYLFDPTSPNSKTNKIFQTLLVVYSKHPVINKNYGKKGIAFRPLFQKTIGMYRTFHRYFKEGKPLSERLAKHILFQAYDDALQLYAPREFRTLLNAISEQIPHWWISTFGIGRVENEMIYYYKEYEPRMKNYFKLSLMNPSLTNRYSVNKYYYGFLHAHDQLVDLFMKREQARILIRQFGGRSPIDGRKFRVNSLGYPTESITAHHYQYAAINPLNYYDCRISALVPIPTSEHYPRGVPHTPEWYKKFSLCKEAIAEGSIPVPMWWSKNIRIDYIRELAVNGLKNYIQLIYYTP